LYLQILFPALFFNFVPIMISV